MATVIIQQPQSIVSPIGLPLMFTVQNPAIVGSFYNVKFIAEVFVSSDFSLSLDPTMLIGRFKAVPNDAGSGMFDFKSVVESFIKADNLGTKYTTFIDLALEQGNPIPIHLIDKFSLNTNVIRFVAVKFSIEGAPVLGGPVAEQPGQEVTSNRYTMINTYVKETDPIKVVGNEFNFSLIDFFMNISPFPKGRFLTNAPFKQYANIRDYGTLSFYINADKPATNARIVYYNSSGSALHIDNIEVTEPNGGYDTYNNSLSSNKLLHFGCFPANLINSSSYFNLGSLGVVDYYIITIEHLAAQISRQIRIYLNCPNQKGFDPIRLTWLNQYGVWDYYTFNLKSTKTISTNGSTYEQLGGTWNEGTYKLLGHKGGKKQFRVNATEKIKMNTEFLDENYNVIFEELINSPEVYLLNDWEAFVAVSTTIPSLSKFIEPVRLTTSSFTTKTIANDKLIQYTIEVEKSRNLRTQSI